MAQDDWTISADSLGTGAIDRGVTAGIAPPNGGGSFIYGMNSLVTTPGGVLLQTAQADFVPCAKGAQITGCVQRGAGGGATGFAPFLAVGGQGVNLADTAYMIGLSDEDPHRIKLVKGVMASGIPAAAVSSPPTDGVLAASANTFTVGTWLHLRLDMIVNGNGDVVLNCYQNDLTVNPCNAPVWNAIPGIAQFIDDALGINSGSAPYTSGYAGFGGISSNMTRRMFFDQITIARQE